MSFLPDVTDLSELVSKLTSSVSTDRLSFSLGDLDVLIDALTFYKHHLIAEEDKPNSTIYCCDDGREYLGVVDELIFKFLGYQFT